MAAKTTPKQAWDRFVDTLVKHDLISADERRRVAVITGRDVVEAVVRGKTETRRFEVTNG